MQHTQPRMRFQVNFDYLLKVTKTIPQPLQKVEEQNHEDHEDHADSDFEEAPLKRQKTSILKSSMDTMNDQISTKHSSSSSSPKNCNSECSPFFNSDKKQERSPVLKTEDKIYECPLNCGCNLTNQKMSLTELTIHLRT